MKIVGLDVGEKRIGVSRADSDTRIAVPVGFIEVNGAEWQEIARVARLNNTNLFVLGMPRSNEGNETAQSVFVRNFAKTLTEKIPGARIKFQDESLTSVMAEERLKASGKRYEKGDIDAEAATIILQDFLESLGNAPQVDNNAGAAPTEGEAPENEENSGIGGSIKTAIAGAGGAVSNVAKKEAGKAKLNSAKVKHKVKTSTKMISGFGILIILIAGAVGGYFVVNHIREENARKRAEEYARLEAEM